MYDVSILHYIYIENKFEKNKNNYSSYITKKWIEKIYYKVYQEWILKCMLYIINS